MWDENAKNWCSYSLSWPDSYLNAVTKRCSCVMSDTLCWTLSPYSRHQSQALSGRPAVWFDDNTDCLICKICINHPTVHIQQSGLENTFRKRETYEAGKMYVRFSIHSQAGNARHGCWMQGDCQHIVYVVHIMYIHLFDMEVVQLPFPYILSIISWHGLTNRGMKESQGHLVDRWQCFAELRGDY